MTPKLRLQTFIASEEISENKFLVLCGLSRGFINSMGETIKDSSLNKITKIFPYLNKEWIKTGEGEMIVGKTEKHIIEIQKLKKPKGDPSIFDKNIAKRFYDFRMTFISESQKEAADLLGTSSAMLSYYESGKRRVRMDIVQKMVVKFDLNSEWLATGLGNKQSKTPAKPTAASSLQSVHQDVTLIKKTLSIYEANLNHAYEVIESQSKAIELLRDELEKLKKS